MGVEARPACGCLLRGFFLFCSGVGNKNVFENGPKVYRGTVDISYTVHLPSSSSCFGTGGAENAGVEKSGAITDGKP